MTSDRSTGGLAVEGEVLDGRYRLVEKLGTGGSAAVFLAEDQRLGRRVAVKVLHPRVGASASPRIEREARQAAALSHPHVVQIHDVVTRDDDAYIVMEHVAGTPLDELLRTEGPCSEERTIELGLMLLGALGAAHAGGMVHRDVKPSNVLVRPDGTAKLADFGTARMGGDTVTEEGTLVGSAAYVAPEQVQGTGESDHRADLYSLGILLYEAVTGVRPFEGDSVAATVIQRLHRDPLPPSAHRPVSPGLEAVILRAMARDPRDRYPDADAMAAALRALQAAVADATQPIPILTSGLGRPRLARVVGGSALGLLLIAGAALAVGWGSAVGTPEDAVVRSVGAVVPELRGMTLERAVAVARAEGFEIESVREVPARSTAGTVVDQVPDAGTGLPADQGIHLIVSAGPDAPTTSPSDAQEPSPTADDAPAPSGGGGAPADTQVEPEPEPEPPADDTGKGRGRPDEPGERGKGKGPNG